MLNVVAQFSVNNLSKFGQGKIIYFFVEGNKRGVTASRQIGTSWGYVFPYCNAS